MQPSRCVSGTGGGNHKYRTGGALEGACRDVTPDTGPSPLANPSHLVPLSHAQRNTLSTISKLPVFPSTTPAKFCTSTSGKVPQRSRAVSIASGKVQRHKRVQVSTFYTHLCGAAQFCAAQTAA